MKLERILIAIGLVFIAISLTMYIHLWADWVPTILAIVLLLGLGFVLYHYISIASKLKESKPFKFHWLFLLTIPFLIFNFVGALSPVTDADGAGYHLAMPKIYLQNKHFDYHPNVISNWPMSAEMVYAWFMLLGIPPKLLHFTFGILLALLVYAIANRYFGNNVAAWSSVLTYTMPMVVLESGIAYVDLFFAFFIVFGLYLLYQFTEERNYWTLFLSSLFLGFGASIKWSGPIFVALTFVFFMIYELLSDKGSVKRTFWYPLPGIFFSSLWYLKNYIFTGQPFIPFYAARNWAEQNVKAYMGTIHNAGFDLPSMFFNFFKLTFAGMDFGELTWIGPIFFTFLPLLALKKNVHKLIKISLLFSGVFWITWYFTSPQSRLLLPILILLIPVVAYAIKDSRICKSAAVIAILLAFPFALLYNGSILFNQNLLEHKIPAYPVYQELNKYEKGLTLVYGDIHTYYLNQPYVWARPDMQGWITDYSNLSKYGIEYVIVNYNDEEFRNIRYGIAENDMVELYEKNGVALWQVKE